MTNIKDTIKGYLNSWIECEYCNHICKVERMSSDCQDNPVCEDCVEEHYMSHWIS